MASYSVFKTKNPITNEWGVVEIPFNQEGYNPHKYGNNPFIFAVQPEQWVKENGQPLVYIAAKVTFDYDVHFWHPEYGYQKGNVSVSMYCEEEFSNVPAWAENDMGWY